MYKILLRLLYSITPFISAVAFGKNDFVKVSESKFTIPDMPHYYANTNCWYGILLAGVNGDASTRQIIKKVSTSLHN